MLKSIPPGVARVGVAVSGGSDSVALLRLMASLPVDQSVFSEIVVLSVDHGLRDGSAADARFVADLAKAHGMHAHILVWQGDKPESGLQEAARQVRYGLMIEKCRELNLDAIITAHTLDDQAETFLMRLKRGSGLDGLASMSPVSTFNDFLILRPLLSVRRQALQNYLADISQSWCEDPSNQNTDFERAQVRQHFPDIEAAGISAENLAHSARRLWRVKQAVDAEVDRMMPQAINWFEAGYAQIDHGVFKALEEEVALRLLSHVLQGVGGGTREPQLQKLERAFADWQNCQVGSGLTLAGCRLVVKKNSTYVVREAERQKGIAPSSGMIMRAGEKRLWDRRFMCELTRAEGSQLSIRPLGRGGWAFIKKQDHTEHDVPSYLAHGLVSLWQEDEVLSVPHIGFNQGEVQFKAKFIPHGMRVLPEMRGFS